MSRRTVYPADPFMRLVDEHTPAHELREPYPAREPGGEDHVPSWRQAMTDKAHGLNPLDRTVCLDCWEEQYPGERLPDWVEVRACTYHVQAHRNDEADDRNDAELLESVFGRA